MAVGLSSSFQDKFPGFGDVRESLFDRVSESVSTSRLLTNSNFHQKESRLSHGSIRSIHNHLKFNRGSLGNTYGTRGGVLSTEERISNAYKIIGSLLKESSVCLAGNTEYLARANTRTSAKSAKPVAVVTHPNPKSSGTGEISQVVSKIHSNFNERANNFSSLKDGANGKNTVQLPKSGRGAFTPAFDPDSKACCTLDKSAITPACGEDPGFCLGSLSAVVLHTRFGGGPGIDREGEEKSGKFCGVGARYRPKRTSLLGNYKKSRVVTRQAFSRKISGDVKSEQMVHHTMAETYTKRIIYSVVCRRLQAMVSALGIMKTLLFPRVPGLEKEVKTIWEEFIVNVKKVFDSQSLLHTVVGFKRDRLKVLTEFDREEFLDMLSLPDEEASAFLHNSLETWNEALRNFLENFGSHSKKLYASKSLKNI